MDSVCSSEDALVKFNMKLVLEWHFHLLQPFTLDSGKQIRKLE